MINIFNGGTIFMKRIVLILLAFVLLFSFFVTGCGSASNNEEGSIAATTVKTAAPAEPEQYFLPLVNAPATITFATTENASGTVTMSQNLPVWVELEKRTGIKVKWQCTSSKDYDQTIQTRLASGTNLPDILRLPQQNPLTYADNKEVIPLTDLINQYAPDIVQLFKDKPEVRNGLITPDGNIYWIASILSARSVVNYPAPIYRKDWASKVGLGAPQTIDDWYNMLRKFKESDMNGNGKDDEIPLYLSGLGELNIFAWSYGLMLSPNDSSTNGATDNDSYQVDSNDKVYFLYTDPRFKEFLTEMNKWYTEGLVNKELFNTTNDDLTAVVMANQTGASAGFNMIAPQWTTNMQQTIPDAYWDTVYPPKGPGGEQHLLQERPLSSELYAISRDCKDPGLVVKWLDYVFASEDGQILIGNYGIEGDTYTMVNGEPQLTDKVIKDPRGTGAVQWEEGINCAVPRILMSGIFAQRFGIFPQAALSMDAASKFYLQMFPNIIPTKEESDTITGIMADINTYRVEMETKFINGTEPLSNFDQYVSKLNSIGIDQVTQIKQQQYDRTSK